MPQEISDLYEFGPFRIDAMRRLLFRDDQQVPLTSRAFDTLLVLVRNRQRVLEKDELLKTIWPDTVVEEANLAQNVSTLRKALGEAAGEHRYIATVPGRGYRFVGDVRVPFGRPLETEMVIERHRTADLAVQEEIETRTLGRRTVVMAASALGILLLAAASWYAWRERAAAAAPRSLAVLPFQALSASAVDPWMGVGLADAVITRLSNVRQIVVRPTTSVLKYEGPAPNLQSVGRELGVDALLDGKVQTSADGVRVTVQLIRVRDGRSLWAATLDEKSGGIFAIEDSVSTRVARALSIQLGQAEQRELERPYTENAEAYRNYLEGRISEFRFTRQGLTQAIEYFNRAIALDPGYAIAWAGLADAYTTASDWVLPPRDALPKAEAAARKALAFDDRLAEAHASLAHSLLHQWRLKSAGEEFHRALTLSPNNTSFYFAYAEYLSALGQDDRAVSELKKALAIDPLSPEIMSFIGWPLNLKGDYAGALATEQKVMSMDADYWVAYMHAAYSCVMLKRYPEAIQYSLKARALNPESTTNLSLLAVALASSGRRAEVPAIFDSMNAMSGQQQYVSPIDFALVYAALGEKDRVFESFGRAYADQSEMLLFLRLYAPLFSLGEDPRFQALARRVSVDR